MKRGFVCGSFDLIHPGYIMLFEDAKKRCDYLIAGLQSDPTIDRPNKNKPVQTYEEREKILKSIIYIDEVQRYDTEKSLIDLIKSINPDIWVIGSDWIGKKFTGHDFGINIYFHERDHNYSTTALKEKIIKQGLR